ncbi:MAG: glutamate-1-semialdehyde 2,1-aminomutase [Phycisphaeraceae bacterium]
MAVTATQTEPHALSHRAFERARRLMPGGVNSPVRAYKAVGREPITIRKGKGARVTDIDRNEYIDYVGSYGPLILGHAPDPVLAALSKAASCGTSFGMPTEAETTLAQRVVDAVPSVELVRFVNSGTEAVMSAIRLARAATGRAKVIKCIGCYHGHSDALLVQAGSGATTLGIPSSPGVPAVVTADTVLVPYNDQDAARRAFTEHADQVACFVVEPIAGNMGCIPPNDGYLATLRRLCDQFAALLIFDEVMTGFRVAYGGAQELYGVRPDLTCLGKIVGGGLPCAAYGGREDLMRQIAPDGPVYQAGTLSGNPLAMAAGIATLDTLREDDAYTQLERTAAALAGGLTQAATKAGIPVCIRRVGSMLTCFFNGGPVENYDQAVASDTGSFAVFFRSMLDAGVVLPPSQFECWFVSTAHDDTCIEQTLEAADAAFNAVAQSRSTVV